MTTKSLAQPAPKTTSRFERGITLAVEHFEEIVRVEPYVWSVPSCSGPDSYRVNLKHGGCSCPDRTPEGERCKHQHAARYVKAKTATCAGCSERIRHRDLVEVGDENLTFFEGELVCEACALAHGVL